jgi:hypothetical protein
MSNPAYLAPRSSLSASARCAGSLSAGVRPLAPALLTKSTWSGPRQLVKLILLKPLERDLRLQKTTVFKSFAATAKMHPKANRA